MLFTSCGGVEQQASRVCRTLLQRQLYAEIQMDKVSQALLAHDVDSLWVLTQQNDGILYYVFGQDGLLYWSDNWLSADYVELFAYDKWQYVRFDNAHAVCRWKDVGAVNLLVVIPIKYAYPVENAELRNRFVAPFRADDDLELSRLRKRDGRDVCSSDGTFLFSLDYKEGGDTRIREGESLAESFSYQRLLTSEDKSKSAVQHARVRLYFWLMLTIFLIFLVIGIVGLLRHHGFRNMPLSTRFQYCIVALLMASFLAIFMIATVYVQRSYVQRQQSSQEEKCRYIQSSLKELYFWDISLSPHNTAGLNEDLRYLSFIYQTDIHVYDMRGNMIGTSTPVLFDKGLVSRHMSPEPYFKQTPTITRNERIGDLNYLSAYTEFMNGSDVQIGYIAVPLFLSHDKVVGEVDSYIALLLPPYLIALLLALFVSFVMARGLTSSFQHIAERMSSFRIGGRNNHIEYAYNDEVGELVGRYNEMVDQLELSAERLARSEREGAWRTMARQIAHEINNPLTPMRLTIQQLQRLKGTERFDEYFSRSTGVLVSEIDRLSRIASSFSTFAKMPEVHVSEVDVAARLEASIALFRNNDAGVPIRYIGPDSGVMALADEEQIAQVFTNIVKNALQALENQQDGDIIVILKEDETLPNTDIPAVEISFSDNGPGIPDDFREKIFVPNFTTKSTGSGLGLAISKNIVEGCDGKICFETCEKGTNFFVYLRKKQ
ncbi:MAG: HAMP domain-containing histidine kinase [Paludibacteraceae bacterium]|nr:HAMP domain-containing histidine kinase [Paludibacteraceae bacterium]